MRVPITWVNRTKNVVSKSKPEWRLPTTSLSLEFLWLLNLSYISPDSGISLSSLLLSSGYFHVTSLCLSPDCLWSLSVFFLSQAPSGRPQASSSTWYHLQHVVDVEDSLGYWEIPEANCSTVVSPSAFIQWLLFTERSWWYLEGRMSEGKEQN